MGRDRDVDPETGGQRRYLRRMGEYLYLTWGDDWNHDDEVLELHEFLGANGYVVVPRHLLNELLAVTAPASNGKLYTAAIAEVRAAVVEAVGPTREDTSPKPQHHPDCDNGGDFGWTCSDACAVYQQEHSTREDQR